MTVLNRTVNCVTLSLFYVGRTREASEKIKFWLWKRLPWCWAEEAAPWISQQLGFLEFHIAFMVFGIAMCRCSQCSLTVGGNFLLHIVTQLDVITVAWYCRLNQDALHPAESPRRVVQTSVWQGSTSIFITWDWNGSCSSLFTAHNCFQRYLTACYGSWTGVTDKFVSWYSALCWISAVQCQWVLHIEVVFN